MKKFFLVIITVFPFAFSTNAQTTGDGCISDFTIELDGTPVTTNGVTTFNIIAKPKNTKATAIINAAGCQVAQWVPHMFVGGAGSKQFCDLFYPQIVSLTLPLNAGNFSSAATIPSSNNGLLPLQKGRWYALNRVVGKCSCSCLESTTMYNFRLDANNNLEICKVQ